jgi:hypothetical protein
MHTPPGLTAGTAAADTNDSCIDDGVFNNHESHLGKIKFWLKMANHS